MSVKEATELLGISEATVRRMFANLENQNKLMRFFGGVRRIETDFNHSSYFYKYEKLESEKTIEKIRIGQHACSFVNDSDVIYISGGTTTYQFTLALAERIKRGEIKDLIITTNSLTNLQALENIHNVVLIGGNYRPTRCDFCGYIAERMIKSLHFTKCFIGIDGIDIENGLMAIEIETARMDEMVISRSNDRYVLASSDKFSKNYFISYAPVNRINHIVTDSELSDDIKRSINELEVDLICT